MTKVLIVFYSRTGHTAKLADAIAEGAERVRFTEVDVRRLPDCAPEDVIASVPAWAESRDALAARYATLGSPEELADYDALIFGSPTRYGIMAAELKLLLDQTGPMWQRGALVNKVGSAFTSVQTAHGGHETTLWSIMTPMANLGMIIVPPGYTSETMFKGGSPFGATATTGVGTPGGNDLEAARHQGERVAEVAGWITHAMSHDAHHHDAR